MTTLSAAFLLFLILDPLGNIPIVLGLLKPLAPKRRRLVLLRELLIALGRADGLPVGWHPRARGDAPAPGVGLDRRRASCCS
jgi:hypothetical protein